MGESAGDCAETTTRALSEFKRVLSLESRASREIHRDGYRIPFARIPNLATREVAIQRNWGVRDDPELSRKWGDLCARGIAEVISDHSTGYYSSSFLIPKKEKGQFRMISDLRGLNKYVIKNHVKIPTLKSVLPSLTKNAWLASFDVCEGYFNCNIHPLHRRYFRFLVGNTVYQLKKLPMGYVGSMEAFRNWLRPYLRTVKNLFPSLLVYDYVDDVLLMFPDKQRVEANKNLRQVYRVLAALGLPIKKKKSMAEVARNIEYLGFQIDTAKGTIGVPARKRRKVRKQVKQTLRKAAQGRLLTRHIGTTVGQIIALLPALKHIRLHAQALYDLQTRAVSSTGWFSNRPVPLDTAAEAELRWWLTFLTSDPKYGLDCTYPCKEITLIASDASDHTIAGVLLRDPDYPLWHRRLNARETATHINYKELLAAGESLRRFKRDIKGHWVNLRVDNTTVVAALNKWSTKQKQLIPLLQEIHAWSVASRTRVTATYINTQSNKVADRLSRDLPVRREDLIEMELLAQGTKAASRRQYWRIHRRARKEVFRAFHMRPRMSVTGKLSATTETIPRGFVPMARKRTLSLFAFPDLQQIPQHLDILAGLRQTALVVLPLWPQAEWFARAAQMSVSLPVVIPPEAILPRRQKKKSWPSWHWIGILLSGKKRKRTSFRKALASRRGSHKALHSVTNLAGVPWADMPKRIQSYLQRFLNLQARARY